MIKKQGDHQCLSVRGRMAAVPQEVVWHLQPLHLVEVGADPHPWASVWHHLLPSSWCSVIDGVMSFWTSLSFSQWIFSSWIWMTHPNADLDSLSLFEAQVQLGCCTLTSFLFCDLAFLFHPPLEKEIESVIKVMFLCDVVIFLLLLLSSYCFIIYFVFCQSTL